MSESCDNYRKNDWKESLRRVNPLRFLFSGSNYSGSKMLNKLVNNSIDNTSDNRCTMLFSSQTDNNVQSKYINNNSSDITWNTTVNTTDLIVEPTRTIVSDIVTNVITEDSFNNLGVQNTFFNETDYFPANSFSYNFENAMYKIFFDHNKTFYFGTPKESTRKKIDQIINNNFNGEIDLTESDFEFDEPLHCIHGMEIVLTKDLKKLVCLTTLGEKYKFNRIPGAIIIDHINNDLPMPISTAVHVLNDTGSYSSTFDTAPSEYYYYGAPEDNLPPFKSSYGVSGQYTYYPAYRNKETTVQYSPIELTLGPNVPGSNYKGVRNTQNSSKLTSPDRINFIVFNFTAPMVNTMETFFKYVFDKINGRINEDNKQHVLLFLSINFGYSTSFPNRLNVRCVLVLGNIDTDKNYKYPEEKIKNTVNKTPDTIAYTFNDFTNDITSDYPINSISTYTLPLNKKNYHNNFSEIKQAIPCTSKTESMPDCIVTRNDYRPQSETKSVSDYLFNSINCGDKLIVKTANKNGKLEYSCSNSRVSDITNHNSVSYSGYYDNQDADSSNVFAEIKKREALNIKCPENKGLTQIQFQERDINGIKQFRVNYNCGKL